MSSDPDVLMVFGTIMIAISSTLGLISVNLNQSATQSMEIGTFSCLLPVQEGYENISLSLNMTNNCEKLLQTSLKAKKYGSLATDFSIIWLIAGVVTLFRAAIRYHNEGRLF